jgi:hypothetical protein
METVAKIGATAACCGVLFFLVCAGLVFWYLFKQKPQVATATAPEPPVQATIEHSSAGSAAAELEPSPGSAPPEQTTGVDG